MNSPAAVESRSHLLSLLSEACELEHGLACSYLYTAFTLKQELAEGGITWEQLQKARLWAAQIYFVASQEMLHLAQAWNLLTAIGGTPYYMRPNFPQRSNYYPLHLPLKLERFGRPAILRFMGYERPRDVRLEDFCPPEPRPADTAPGEDSFTTVAELYRLIEQGFCALPEEQLFIGAPDRQVGPELVDFPDLCRVVNRASAVKAIEQITEQGEGTPADRADCHFGIFRNILRELEAAPEGFAPARRAIQNPVAHFRGNYGAPGTQLIKDDDTRAVAELFDEVYSLMLRLLQYVFDNNTGGDAALRRRFAVAAIALMTTVIKPLGEALTLLPAGKEYGDRTAGPAFGLSRHVPLPSDEKCAGIIAREQLSDAADRCAELARRLGRPPQLASAARNLKSVL